jgi:hypothetical protein
MEPRKDNADYILVGRYTLSQHSDTVWKHSYSARVMGRTLPLVSNNFEIDYHN